CDRDDESCGATSLHSFLTMSPPAVAAGRGATLGGGAGDSVTGFFLTTGGVRTGGAAGLADGIALADVTISPVLPRALDSAAAAGEANGEGAGGGGAGRGEDEVVPAGPSLADVGARPSHTTSATSTAAPMSAATTITARPSRLCRGARGRGGGSSGCVISTTA